MNLQVTSASWISPRWLSPLKTFLLCELINIVIDS